MIEIMIILAIVAFMVIHLNKADKKQEKITDIVIEEEPASEDDAGSGTFDSYLERGRRFYKEGALGKAERMFIEAVKKNPADSRSYRGLAKIYTAQENNEDAIASLERVCQISPDDDVSYNNIGLLYFKQKDFPKAKSAYEKAISLDKSKYQRYINLALVLKEMGDFGKAADVLEESFKLEERPETLKMIIEIAESMKDEKRKGIAFRKLLEIEPENSKAKRGLARTEESA